jgi:hypothetical protein
LHVVAVVAEHCGADPMFEQPVPVVPEMPVQRWNRYVYVHDDPPPQLFQDPTLTDACTTSPAS